MRNSCFFLISLEIIIVPGIGKVDSPMIGHFPAPHLWNGFVGNEDSIFEEGSNDFTLTHNVV